MFLPAGGDVIAVDWQTMMVGLPARDLSYFLGTSLETDHRRRAERHLVAGYHSELLRRRVAEYDADRCFDDYRFAHLQGPMMFLAMARRSCAAIRDLESLSLI